MIKKLISIRILSLLSSSTAKKKYGSKKNNGTNKAALVGFAVLYAFVGLVFMLLFGMMAFSSAFLMISMGLDAMYFGLFTIIAFTVIFFLSIFETKSELFEGKDNELLLSMPIKPGDIVISRIFTVLILNYIVGAIVLLPALAAYTVFGGSFVGIFGGLLILIFMPLIATSLSSAVGYLVALIAKRVKGKTLVTVLASIAFVAIYLVGYSAYFAFLGESEEEMVENIVAVASNPLIAGVGSVAMFNPIALPIFLALSVGGSYIAYRLISRGYFSIVSSAQSHTKSIYKGEIGEKRSLLAALAAKEMRRFVSSATYMLNSSAGIIFILLLGGAAVFSVNDLWLISSALPFGNIIPAALTVALVLCSSMIMISASALSLEGDCFWIPRSMPISARTALTAKLIPHILVSSVTTLIASVVFIFISEPTVIEAILMLLIPIFANVMFALLGLTLNVAFPKLDYDNEAQPVKQSAPVALSMLFGLIFSVICAGVCIFLAFVGYIELALLAVLALVLILSVVLFLLLYGPCARKYDRL